MLTVGGVTRASAVVCVRPADCRTEVSAAAADGKADSADSVLDRAAACWLFAAFTVNATDTAEADCIRRRRPLPAAADTLVMAKSLDDTAGCPPDAVWELRCAAIPTLKADWAAESNVWAEYPPTERAALTARVVGGGGGSGRGGEGEGGVGG